MKASIDVVIASYRLEEKFILPLLQLTRPAAATTKFYVVLDNPTLQPSAAICNLIDDVQTFLIINSHNIGASASRNKGLEAGNGEWVLFLDDDIEVPENLLLVYEAAIAQHVEEPGFIGLINFPPPPTNFAKALVDSGAVSIFGIAASGGHHAWGPSANFAINRRAAGNAKFSTLYPKSGGGEDVDFFFQVRELNGRRNFKLLPQAYVTHPWWANGKRQLTRFFRYGTGNALLPIQFPSFRYFDFPNILEINVLTGCLFCMALFFKPVLLFTVLFFLAASMLFEFLFTWIDNWLTNRRSSLSVAINIFLIRYAGYLGYLYANWFIYKKPLLLFDRFNFSGQPRKSLQLNRRKIIKGIFYILLIFLLILTQ